MRYCERCRATFQSLRSCPRDNIPTRADLSDPLLGVVLGDRYRILDRIAAGGMGQVYRAAHVRIASLFALKVLYGDVAHDPDMRSRFQREAEAASCLSSRHIVRVVDFGESAEGLSYLAMEYVDGANLGSVLSQKACLPEERAVEIARQIARGLAHAHERGVVHRDLKPENVMMVDEDDDEDVVKILDFGLAQVRTEKRLTRAGQIFGTPQYMAPEQYLARDVDARTDLYALGVMLFEMLTGLPPFEGATIQELMRMHLSEPPSSMQAVAPAVTVTPALEAIVQKLLAKEPERRFASARALLDALRTIGAPVPSSAASTPSLRAVPASAPPKIEAAIRDGAPAYNTGDHARCLRIYRETAEGLLSGELVGQIASSARLRTALLRASRTSTPSEGAWEIRYGFDDLLHAAYAPRPQAPDGIPLEIAIAEVVMAQRYAAGHLDLVGDYYLELTRSFADSVRATSANAPLAVYLDGVAAAAVQVGGGQRSLAYVREALSNLGAASNPTLTSAAFSTPSSSMIDDCPSLDHFAHRITQALGVGVPAYNAGDVAGCARVYRQTAEAIVQEIGSNPACARVAARLHEALRDAAGTDEGQNAWALRHAFDDLLASAAKKRSSSIID